MHSVQYLSIPTNMCGRVMKAHNSIASRYGQLHAATWEHPYLGSLQFLYGGHDYTPSTHGSHRIYEVASKNRRVAVFDLHLDGEIRVTYLERDQYDPLCLALWLTEERGVHTTCQACPFQLTCMVQE